MDTALGNMPLTSGDEQVLFGSVASTTITLSTKDLSYPAEGCRILAMTVLIVTSKYEV